ncbi:MAG: hypothetical protein F7C07_04730 [Desulfurococcales archaeon]|nr:hypothetical protein [Desulfurococcales archaeon]
MARARRSRILVDKRFKALAASFIAVMLVVIAAALYPGQEDGSAKPPLETGVVQEVEAPKRALIYDSLYREYPNDKLLENVINILEGAGYEVEVYLGRNATVDPLYSLGEYDIILFRAHGAFNSEEKGQFPKGAYIYTGLYLKEANRIYGGYPVKWIDEGLMAKGIIPPPGVRLSAEELSKLPRYLTLSPKFFEEKIGDLKEGSIVMFFGCYGMDDDSLASVFLSKGAMAYIAWEGNVTWVYMDSVLPQVLEMIVQGELDSIEGSVEPDPYTGSTLRVALAAGG